MEQMKRFAIYYAPEEGSFASAAAAWLGYDVVSGQPVVQPRFELPRSLADATADPRKYGFHATLKAPFRLAEGVTPQDLSAGLAALVAQIPAVQLTGLRLADLDGFMAFVPADASGELQAMAARLVQDLDRFRAPLTAEEFARRRPERLSPRQRELLETYGYPYVLEQFQFHMTLTGPLALHEDAAFRRAISGHFDGVVPQPVVMASVCLMGEDDQGRFHLLERHALRA